MLYKTAVCCSERKFTADCPLLGFDQHSISLTCTGATSGLRRRHCERIATLGHGFEVLNLILGPCTHGRVHTSGFVQTLQLHSSAADGLRTDHFMHAFP